VHASETVQNIAGTPYTRYYRRNTGSRQRLNINWTGLSQNLSFFVGSSQGAAETQSVGDGVPSSASITIDESHLIVLMGTGPKKLTEAEKILFTHFLSVTLLHEIAHAYGIIRWGISA